MVNAYLLTAAVFIILGGDAADRFGARYSSTAGIGLFAFASLVIAIAPAGWAVIGARALQGLGAAFAVAGTLAAVTEASPEPRRAEAIGTWTGFLMLGFSIGPLIGGAITHYAGWRFIFWLNVFAMMGAGLILSLHPGTKGHPTKSTDWVGVGFLAGFMVPLIIGLQALNSCPDYPEGGNCRACASDPCVRRTVVVGDAASSTGRRLPFVFESQFRSRFRPCVSADVRHHRLCFSITTSLHNLPRDSVCPLLRPGSR